MTDMRRDEYVVYLGTRDWRHEPWVGGFYPEDMPEDWRFAFYATQFSCVWLEAAQWRGAAPDEVRTWLEEAPEGFRFLLQRAPGVGPAPLPDVWASDRCVSLEEEDGHIVWFDPGSDLRVVSERVRGAGPDGPVYLLSRDNDLAAVERVRTLLELLGI